MINPTDSNKTVLINLDVLFDFPSILFSVYRTHFTSRENIDIGNYKCHLENKDIKEGLKSLMKALDSQKSVEDVLKSIKQNLEMSITCIKPVIGTKLLGKIS